VVQLWDGADTTLVTVAREVVAQVFKKSRQLLDSFIQIFLVMTTQSHLDRGVHGAVFAHRLASIPARDADLASASLRNRSKVATFAADETRHKLEICMMSGIETAEDESAKELPSLACAATAWGQLCFCSLRWRWQRWHRPLETRRQSRRFERRRNWP